MTAGSGGSRWPARAILATVVLCHAPYESVAELRVGDRAPALSVERLLQAPQTSLDLPQTQDHVLVLEFWGTWCTPCLKGIPHLNELVARFRDKPVRFISITDEPASVVEPFLERTTMRGWIALDPDRSTFAAFEIAGLPKLVLVGADGRIAAITAPSELTVEILDAALAGRQVTGPHAAAVGTRGDPMDTAGKPPLFQVTVRPVGLDDYFSKRGGRSTRELTEQFVEARGVSLKVALGMAYDIPESRIVHPFLLPDGIYDFIVRPGRGTPYGWRGFLQQAIQAAFGFTARMEKRSTEVLVLTALEGAGHRLLPGTPPSGLTTGGARLGIRDAGVDGLVQVLEVSLRRIVIDETQLRGRYDCELTWDSQDPESIFRAIPEQLGLVLEPRLREIEVLVLDRPPAETDPRRGSAAPGPAAPD